MVATRTKASQLESTSPLLATNVTASLLTLYVPTAALAGMLFWPLADWNVYLQLEPNSRLTRLEQLTLSAVVGALVTGIPFSLFWLFRSSSAGHFWLGRFSFLMGIGGAVLGWASLYLSWRLGGDFWTHFQLLGIDGLGYLILGLAALFVSQPAALALGLFLWRKPFGKAAVAVPTMSALLFAGILVLPLIWNYLLAS